MLTLTAHQTGYIPWLGFFHKVALADVYVHFDQVQYTPKDFINRNKIKTSNGSCWLTVPVLKKGHREKNIAEIEINNTEKWREKHWKTIYANYKRAPYFNRYAQFLNDLYHTNWQRLTELNFYVLIWLLKELDIKTKVVRAGDYNFEGSKSDLVLNMCKQLGANTYIFGSQGINYADINSFEMAKIKPVFQDYQHPVYNQLCGDFVPYMSVLDLLFNEGPNSLDIIMSGNIQKCK